MWLLLAVQVVYLFNFFLRPNRLYVCFTRITSEHVPCELASKVSTSQSQYRVFMHTFVSFTPPTDMAFSW